MPQSRWTSRPHPAGGASQQQQVPASQERPASQGSQPNSSQGTAAPGAAVGSQPPAAAPTAAAASERPYHPRPPHPMGGCQRGVIFSVAMEVLSQTAEKDSQLDKALQSLIDMPISEIDKMIFRCKPNHPTHKPQWSWVWSFTLSESCSPEFMAKLQVIIGTRTQGIRFARMHSKDGNLVRWLLEWQKAQRG